MTSRFLINVSITKFPKIHISVYAFTLYIMKENPCQNINILHEDFIKMGLKGKSGHKIS